MKINPDNFLLDSISLDKNKNLFFIGGQEETLIQKILEIIVLSLKKEGANEVIKILNADVDNDSLNEHSNSLFAESKILVRSARLYPRAKIIFRFVSSRQSFPFSIRSIV